GVTPAFVNGVKDVGTAGPVAGTDQFKSPTGSITYTGATTLHINSPTNTNAAINTKLVLTMTAGTFVIDSTGGTTPANNNNGDIGSLFRVTSAACTGVGVPNSCCPGAGGSCFTLNAKVQANFPNAACVALNTPQTCCTGAGTGTCSTTPSAG